MSNTVISSDLNDTNITCSFSLQWSQSTINDQIPALYICIVAAIIHSVFWLQLAFCASVRQKSMQWLYAYLATDILLLFRFFCLFIVHTTSTGCASSAAWYFFFSYFEAVFDNYINTLEVYILLALNVCRYFQIVRNVNVYTTYAKLLIYAHVIVYLIPLITYVIQICVGWAQLRIYVGSSCDIQLTTVYAQTINVILCFALPICLNLWIMYLNMHHVHLSSSLGQAQHHVTAREKYHRSLVIQFLVFYTIWLLLWSPNLLIYQFTSGSSDATSVASLLNFIEIALDPIIIAGLDVRFQKIWFKLWIRFTNATFRKKKEERKIVPTTTNIVRSTGFGRHTTSHQTRSLAPLQPRTINLPT